MDELETLKALASVGGQITVVGLLLVGFWLLVVGKLKTEGHHKEVVDAVKLSEERGWEAAEKATAALAENNKTVDRLADTIAELTRTITADSRRR